MTVNPSSLTMDTRSSRYLSLSVTPSSASYSVNWSSSNANIATVSGSAANATVNSLGQGGTAVITAAVKDNSTGISSVLYDEFYSDFGVRLPGNATIRFSSTGATSYGELFLLNGRSIAANTNYSFTDFQDTYFTPYKAGTFTIPYALSYDGRTLSGTMYIYIRGANFTVSVDPKTMSLHPQHGSNLPVADGGQARAGRLRPLPGCGKRRVLRASGSLGGGEQYHHR